MAVLPSKRSRNTPNNLVVEKNLLKEAKTDTESKDPETETDQPEETPEETSK